MDYKINILGHLVDEYGQIILEDCPVGVLNAFEQLQEEIDELIDEKAQLKLDYEGLEIENSDYRSKIRKLESDLEILEGERSYEDLIEEIKTLKGDIMDLEDYVEELKEQLKNK